MTQTILVTGAAGFIGRHLVDRLKASRFKVIAIDKAQVDLNSSASCKKLARIPGPIALVHLAALVPHVPSKEPRLEELLKGNLIATENLLLALKGKLKSVSFVSTLEVYGIPKSLPIKESHPTQPVSLYGISKLCAEHFTSLLCQRQGIPWRILRCSYVYGPGENYDRAIPNFIKAALSDRPVTIYGDGSDIRDYVYVGDVCEAILLSLKSANACGVFNIASGKRTSILALAKLISRLCASGSDPKFIGRKKPAYNIVFDTGLASEKLKFHARTALRDGLLKEIEWMRHG